MYGPTRATWDAAGDCQSPVPMELHAWPTRMPVFNYLHGDPGVEWFDDRNPTIETPKYPEGKRGVQHGISLAMHVPCRRCANCLRRRAASWRHRMLSEYGASSRTWFGTLTLAPQAQYLASAEAASRAYASAVDWRQLSEEEQFGRTVSVVYEELQRYMKRVRKASGAALRYIAVVERHKSGLPHIHMLVHESISSVPVRHSVLADKWTAGFEKWRLVKDKREVIYVAKYLSKTLLARVRASQGYGVLVTSYEIAKLPEEVSSVGKDPLPALSSPSGGTERSEWGEIIERERLLNADLSDCLPSGSSGGGLSKSAAASDVRASEFIQAVEDAFPGAVPVREDKSDGKG